MAQTYYKAIRAINLAGINGKTTGAVKIGTTENGTERFHPLFATFACSAATSVTIVPTVSIGTNASSYNNIIAAAAITGVSALNTVLQSNITAAVGTIAPNTDIYVNITVGATATTMTFEVNLFGYYN